MNKILQILLILAILVTALFGLGFGLCGALGISSAIQQPSALMFVLSLIGLVLAALAGGFIYFVLWKGLQRLSREDEDDRSS